MFAEIEVAQFFNYLLLHEGEFQFLIELQFEINLLYFIERSTVLEFLFDKFVPNRRIGYFRGRVLKKLGKIGRDFAKIFIGYLFYKLIGFV